MAFIRTIRQHGRRVDIEVAAQAEQAEEGLAAKSEDKAGSEESEDMAGSDEQLGLEEMGLVCEAEDVGQGLTPVSEADARSAAPSATNDDFRSSWAAPVSKGFKHSSLNRPWPIAFLLKSWPPS